MHYFVTVLTHTDAPRTYDLDSFAKDPVLLGRGPFHGETGAPVNDIILPAGVSLASRAQCRFQRRGDEWICIDENSHNGMFIQNTSVSSAVLTHGLELAIGARSDNGCLIRVTLERESSSSVPRPPRESIPEKRANVRLLSLKGIRQFTIGRNPDCSLVISHPAASRIHAIIRHSEKGYYLCDNHSRNGINYNGTQLFGSVWLKDRDRFTIAATSFTYFNESLYTSENINGVQVQAIDLCQSVRIKKKKQKLLLDRVNISIAPGEFAAIIGGSGAGKTTLLNCLSGLSPFSTGSVLINGDRLQENSVSLKSIIGYVPQKDIVYDNLTLEKMLYYSAKLRISESPSEDEINAKIRETLDLVELTGQKDTLIGKLSGGQKKRASIAVELLSNPKLFFLDEPFSGLDPGTESKLMHTLRRISRSGHTVIMITHSILNLSLCDRVICMGRGGRICYSGPADGICQAFGCNEISGIYELLDKDSRRLSERYRLAAAQGGAQVSGVKLNVKKSSPRDRKRRSSRQFPTLTRRYTELCLNRRSRLTLLLLMPVILSVFVCAAFTMDAGLSNFIYNLCKSIPFLNIGAGILTKTTHPFLVYADTQSAMLTFSCAAFWIGMFNTVQEVSSERNIYEREAFSGVDPLPYIGSKLVFSSVLCLVQSFLMTLILVIAANYVQTLDGDITAVTSLKVSLPSGGVVFTGSLWIEFFITTLLTTLSASCFGLVISSLCSNEMALVLCPIALLPQILFSDVVSELSGIIATVSKFISCRWSILAYCTSSNVNSMYESVKYEAGQCGWVYDELDSVVAKYSSETGVLFDLNPVLSAWVALLGICVLCVFLSVLALRFRSVPIREIPGRLVNSGKQYLQTFKNFISRKKSR